MVVIGFLLQFVARVRSRGRGLIAWCPAWLTGVLAVLSLMTGLDVAQAAAQGTTPPQPPTTATADPASQTDAGEPRFSVSGSLRIRYEHTTAESGVPERDKGTVRAQLAAIYRPAPHVEAVARATTGDPSNPRAAGAPFDDFAHKLEISLDQAYLRVRNHGVSVAAGKIPTPFVTTELVWDGDVNPEGVTGEVALPRTGRISTSLTGLLFVIDERQAAPDSRMVGTQVTSQAQLSDATALTMAAGYSDYQLVTLSSSDVRSNRLTADGQRYLSDFNLLTLLARVSYGGQESRWPVSFTTEYVRNTGAATPGQQGLSLEMAAGRIHVSGANRVRYGYMAADQDAVLAAFSHDNIPLATAYRLHSLSWDWYRNSTCSTNVTFFLFRGTEDGAGPYQARLRLNVAVEF
jgi:hypothetical protein